MNTHALPVHIAAALVLSGLLSVRAAEPADAPPKAPLSPADALKTFHLDAGLRVELVASEPEIESPVAMAFDEDGKLWVVEMRDYPNGPAPGQPPEGRIKILEDKDGDGRYETSRVFADQLLFANGLQPWKGGVFVTAAPHILYMKDTDGDGKADQKDVLFEGFATGNPQLRVSYPLLGIDGWVYCCNGLRGGSIKRVKKEGKPSPPVATGGLGSPLNLSGKDFRFDPNNPDRFEAISGMGQFGHTFDDWGNRFICDNNHHLRHVVLEDRYIKRNPYLAVPAVVEDISELEPGPLSSGGKIYPLTRNWTTSSLHAGRFTAACGVFIYRGALLGEPYRGAAFTCDPTGNLVHMEILRPHGATFRSKPHKQGVEFLASTDEWFRPVFLTSGPDGALYIVDMYRAVIEHPEFVPAELKNRPDLTLGKERGRIWRVVPQSFNREPKASAPPRLSQASIADLSQRLDHPANWSRETAFRLLLEHRDFDGGELETAIKRFTSPQALLLASWLKLWKSRDFDPLVSKDDPSPNLRAHWVRLHRHHLTGYPASKEPGLTSEQRAWRESCEKDIAIVFDHVLNLARDPDPQVRFQVALALGEPSADRALTGLAKIALQDVDDRWTRWAVESSVPDRAGKLIAELFKQGLATNLTPARLTLVQELAALVGARQDVEEVKQTLATLAEYSGRLSPHARLVMVLGLAEGMDRRGKQLSSFLRAQQTSPDTVIIATATAEIQFRIAEKIAREYKQPDQLPVRLDAVRLLAFADWERAQGALPQLLSEDIPQDLRLAAVRSLAAHQQKEVPSLLMKGWKSYSPPVRREVLEAMLRQPERSEFLLKELEAGRVKPGDIDPARTQQLAKHAKAEIRDKAKKLLQDSLPEERKQVLARYQAALKVKGDPKQGRDVFQKHCATCHRVAGIGVDVGADIADTRTKTPEQLLNDILNPNAAIDANYINYIVQTRAGRVVTGVIATETASSVTLKRAENQVETILRQDIEEMQSSGQSLMPEGLEKEITVEQMAHLIDFLKSWRYLEEGAPKPGPQGAGLGGQTPSIRVEEKGDHILIDTDLLQARINKKGYVSGIAAGNLLDKKTGAKDVGFGLHIMDFLLAPGWRDDGYPRDEKLHGKLPKHYVEGPQICTQARELKPEIIRHKDFVAVRLKYTFHQPGQGYKAGSTWVQTLVFMPNERFVLCDEQITSINDVENLFYRIDMPGHVRHTRGDTFDKVYLSYHGEIPAKEFENDFAPDARFFYERLPNRIPERMIRAYQVKKEGKPGPWLAGMTLEPSAVSEAWCHQRGYVCMIQENHRARVKAGETFGAAYVVGWFDSIKDMEQVYDQYKRTKAIVIEEDRIKLRK